MLFSFNLNIQLLVTLQNVNEVNREALSPLAASSVYDSTKHNGLVTVELSPEYLAWNSNRAWKLEQEPEYIINNISCLKWPS